MQTLMPARDSNRMAKSAPSKTVQQLQLSLLNITEDQVESLADKKASIDASLDDAFDGFVGNEGTISRLRTMLKAAKLRGDTQLSRVLMFSGPASVGKTELAGRVARFLSLPFLSVDGTSVKTREQLASMITDTIEGHNLQPENLGKIGGIVTIKLPPMVIFIDEFHLVSTPLQEALLTVTDANNRTMLVERPQRFRFNASQVTFILATTMESKVTNALLSRCDKIELRRYGRDEVAEIVQRAHPHISFELCQMIADASRYTPREALQIAVNVNDAIAVADADQSMDSVVREVIRSRGSYLNGITQRDVTLMRILKEAHKPMSLTAIVGALHLNTPTELTEVIEPYLLYRRWIMISSKGREITRDGIEMLRFIDDYERERGA
jgi:Holliday junction resolvasome RuvABC ATP-dependent DNA helicase subunit